MHSVFFGVSTIIGYYYYSKEKEIDTKTQLLYNMQIISLSIALMTAFVPLINRVLYYGMAYELLYLPNMLKLINNRREKKCL
ncbi:MAG: EpsG family protein [Faecalibacterium prausnitzii]